MNDDPVAEIEERIRDLFAERSDLIMQRNLGVTVGTDKVLSDVIPDNVTMFPYKEKAYEHARQKGLDAGLSGRTYPY